MKFKTQFNQTLEPIKSYSSDDKVVRSLRDECDINVIFDKYCAQDSFPVVREATYDTVSYNDAKKLIDTITSDYDTLPSKVRAEFGSVESYVDHMTRATSGDVSCFDKMVNLGILKRPIVEEPTIIPDSSQTLVNEPASNVSSAVTTPTESN